MRRVPSPGSRVLGPIVFACLLVTSVASAQTRKVELGLGAVASGAGSAGDVNATLIDSSGNPLVLFRTENRVAPGLGAELHLAVRVKPRVSVELSGSWLKADLESRVTSDFEDAPSMTTSQGVNQFTVDSSVVYRFARRGKVDPFLRAGAGWLREITSDRALVENGLSANLGGGIKYWMGRVAIRVEARLAVRHGGIAFGDAGVRLAPVIAAGLVIGR
jgi:hypothetical protein